MSHAFAHRRVSGIRFAAGGLVAVAAVLLAADPAFAHEDQVIRLGSFFGGFSHPVLGLDHFLAMVSVGIVSSMLGGRSIWIVPATFVGMMALGGLGGWIGIGLGGSAIEGGIAVSVVLLGAAIAADRSLAARWVLGAVVFFGFFHGYAHGAEVPEIARPLVYALGFLLGTAFIHLIGVVVGEVARRYVRGRAVLRVVGAGFVVFGLMFITGVM